MTGAMFDAHALFLAVEISDTSLAIDLNAKRADYALTEIPNYWVVDINARQLHVMATPRDGDYLDRRVIDFGTPVAVPGTEQTIVID